MIGEPMNLTIISDLHVDISGQEPLPKMEGEYLIIAGDVSNSAKKTWRTVNELSKGFRKTFFVDGNHEHYNNRGCIPPRTIEDTKDNLVLGLDEDIHYLSYGWYDLNDEYRIIGTNGWYSMDYDRDVKYNVEFWVNYMNDYRCIFKGLNNKFPNILALEEAAKLKIQLEKIRDLGKKAIVVTHTVPHEDLLWHKPYDPSWERAHAFYLNKHMQKLGEEFSDVIEIWAYGHSHLRNDISINNIRFICNPRGYPGEVGGWSPITVEI